MVKLITAIFIVLLLIGFLTPEVREYLNDKLQSLLFKEAKDRENEKKLIGVVDTYNPQVKEIQEILKKAGFSPGPIDGRIGWQTRRAIREFQEAEDLKITGTINEETWLKLKEKKASVEEVPFQFQDLLVTEELVKVKPDEGIKKNIPPQKKDIKDIKEKVPKDRKKQIQIALQKSGFYKGKIDGKIGPKTKQAIKDFQKLKGLKVDGVVGKKTWKELEKYL